jgi:hypothetical protein
LGRYLILHVFAGSDPVTDRLNFLLDGRGALGEGFSGDRGGLFGFTFGFEAGKSGQARLHGQEEKQGKNQEEPSQVLWSYHQLDTVKSFNITSHHNYLLAFSPT